MTPGRDAGGAPHVALVTGGSRGIGAAIGRELHRRGAAVILAARDERACAALAKELGAAGAPAFALALDVADPESIARGAERARAIASDVAPGARLDWLVNNAGIAITAPLGTVVVEDGRDLYERHLDVNFHGARRLVDALVGEMKAAGYGRVVNVGSSAGLRGYPYTTAYCASKFALVGYTLAAAVELQRTGVTVNAVCPHYVESSMLERSIERIVAKTGQSPADVRALLERDNPGGRIVRAEEVAAAVADLLAGDENGTLVELDGGERPRFLHPNAR
jgi:NAD(P)-dependent dehydrogenase (short-subunit alcohol dehydrogenase family)